MVTAAELARRTGLKATAISTFINAKWKGSPGTEVQVANKLCRAIDVLLKQREAADNRATEGYVATGLAEDPKCVY